MDGILVSYRLPPLNGLRAFEAAGRHLSFKLAAQASLVVWLGIANCREFLKTRSLLGSLG